MCAQTMEQRVAPRLRHSAGGLAPALPLNAERDQRAPMKREERMRVGAVGYAATPHNMHPSLCLLSPATQPQSAVG